MMNSEKKKEFEITFFKDYITFGISFRIIDIEILKDRYFKTEDKNIKHLIFLNMVKEFFHFIEDFGAICYGIKQRSIEPSCYIIDTLIDYSTESAKFKNLFKNCETFKDYSNTLGLKDYYEYFKNFRNINLSEYNKLIEKFASNLKNIKNWQQKFMKYYQSLKHFGFIVSKEGIFHKSIVNNNLEYPAIMLKERVEGKECYKPHILKYNDDFIKRTYKNSIALAIFLIEIIVRFIYTHYKYEFVNFLNLSLKTANILDKKYNSC
ncbi:hypothetical protein CEE39_04125 [bacterium (candidate division B38) B3_B38]|nr:MAG: hypothetical protein CEE39_04125 [bacterium (candidate division B38) B3_B38]